MPSAGDEDEGARTAAGVWREAGILDDDTTDDDSVGGANTQEDGRKRCVCGIIRRRREVYMGMDAVALMCDTGGRLPHKRRIMASKAVCQSAIPRWCGLVFECSGMFHGFRWAVPGNRLYFEKNVVHHETCREENWGNERLRVTKYELYRLIYLSPKVSCLFFSTDVAPPLAFDLSHFSSMFVTEIHPVRCLVLYLRYIGLDFFLVDLLCTLLLDVVFGLTV